MNNENLVKAKEALSKIKVNMYTAEAGNLANISIAHSLLAIAEVLCNDENKFAIPVIEEINPYDTINEDLDKLSEFNNTEEIDIYKNIR